MTSNPHAPHVLRSTRATMGYTKGREHERASQTQKVELSSDRGLQHDPVKLESLVIADQLVGEESLPGR